MKTKVYYILNIFIILISTNVFAQTTISYDFNSSTKTYVRLENATLAVEANETWEPFYIEYGAESEFAYDLFGEECQGFFNFLSPNLLVGGLFDSYSYDYDALLPFIIPTALQFQNRANITGNDPSLIQYTTEGETGSRIFKMEFANAGFYLEADALQTMDIFSNVQIWVYETTNCIEFHYGPNSITNEALLLDGDPGHVVGLVASTGDQFSTGDFTYSMSLRGDPANPTENELENGNSYDDASYLTSHPADGQVYTFCPDASPVNTRQTSIDLDWSIYPNPVEETMTINTQDITDGSYQILSIDGKLITEGKINFNQQNINVQNYAPGHYLTKVSTNEGFNVKRFFKAQ